MPAPELAHLPAPGRARTLADGLDHPEDVAWDPVAGVVWAGGEDGQLYRVDPATGATAQAGRAPGFVLGLAVDGAGRLAVCAAHDGSLCVFDGERTRRLLTGVGGERLVQPNSATFAPDGTLYLSASGRWGADDGRIVRLRPDGGATTLSRAPRCFTNGLAVSPDGRWLWCVESYRPRVSRLDLRADGAPEVVRELPGTVPDGLALTADGGLLIACYRPDRIYHLDATGALDVVAQDPQGTLLAAPTNVCFIGERLDRVVSANLGRWHLTLLDLDLRGVAPHRPARWAADAVAVA